MAYDYYAIAAKIANKLSSLGKDRWENQIKGAIESGSTGTEILMALRCHFIEIRKKEVDLDHETGRLIDEILKELNKTLSE